MEQESTMDSEKTRHCSMTDEDREWGYNQQKEKIAGRRTTYICAQKNCGHKQMSCERFASWTQHRMCHIPTYMDDHMHREWASTHNNNNKKKFGPLGTWVKLSRDNLEAQQMVLSNRTYLNTPWAGQRLRGISRAFACRSSDPFLGAILKNDYTHPTPNRNFPSQNDDGLSNPDKSGHSYIQINLDQKIPDRILPLVKEYETQFGMQRIESVNRKLIGVKVHPKLSIKQTRTGLVIQRTITYFFLNPMERTVDKNCKRALQRKGMSSEEADIKVQLLSDEAKAHQIAKVFGYQTTTPENNNGGDPNSIIIACLSELNSIFQPFDETETFEVLIRLPSNNPKNSAAVYEEAQIFLIPDGWDILTYRTDQTKQILNYLHASTVNETIYDEPGTKTIEGAVRNAVLGISPTMLMKHFYVAECEVVETFTHPNPQIWIKTAEPTKLKDQFILLDAGEIRGVAPGGDFLQSATEASVAFSSWINTLNYLQVMLLETKGISEKETQHPNIRILIFRSELIPYEEAMFLEKLCTKLGKTRIFYFGLPILRVTQLGPFDNIYHIPGVQCVHCMQSAEMSGTFLCRGPLPHNQSGGHLMRQIPNQMVDFYNSGYNLLYQESIISYTEFQEVCDNHINQYHEVITERNKCARQGQLLRKNDLENFNLYDHTFPDSVTSTLNIQNPCVTIPQDGVLRMYSLSGLLSDGSGKRYRVTPTRHTTVGELSKSSRRKGRRFIIHDNCIEEIGKEETVEDTDSVMRDDEDFHFSTDGIQDLTANSFIKDDPLSIEPETTETQNLDETSTQYQ